MPVFNEAEGKVTFSISERIALSNYVYNSPGVDGPHFNIQKYQDVLAAMLGELSLYLEDIYSNDEIPSISLQALKGMFPISEAIWALQLHSDEEEGDGLSFTSADVNAAVDGWASSLAPTGGIPVDTIIHDDSLLSVASQFFPNTAKTARTKKVVVEPYVANDNIRSAFSRPAHPEKFTPTIKPSLPPEPFPYRDHFVGLEIEIEGCNVKFWEENPETGRIRPTSKLHGLATEVWQEHEDGSLRNGGREFTTRLGVTAGMVLPYLPIMHSLFEQGKLTSSNANKFSFRCGLHLHVDVGQLTLEQLYKALLVSTAVEKLFFAISGNRDKDSTSKFCLPAVDCISRLETLLTYGHRQEWDQFVQELGQGHKYMGINFRAVASYNTLEFRHHEGTSNPETLKRWMLVVMDAVLASKDRPVEELEDLLISGDFDSFVHICFPNSAAFLKTAYNWRGLLKQGIIFVKHTFISEPEKLFIVEHN